MTRPKKWWFVGAALTAPFAAWGSETVDYSYDPLGRLSDISTTSGPNAGTAAATRYDPAGNRASHSVSGAGAAMGAPASQTAIAQPADGVQESAAGHPTGSLDASALEEEVPAVPVDPPAGIPDEAEPVVEIGPPEGEPPAAGPGGNR